MTVTKKAFEPILVDFPGCVLPRTDGSTNENVVNKVGIPLVTMDHLAALYRTSIPYVYYPDLGRDDRMSCYDFVLKAFGQAFHFLLNTDVQIVVICIDAYGRRRIEKTATKAKRSRAKQSGMPEKIGIPHGQSEYFINDRPMPCNVVDIFEDMEIKGEFYAYLVKVFSSELIQILIPEGKKLILSRGVELQDITDPETGLVRRRRPVVVPPLEVTLMGSRYMHECVNDNISEGDLDAWYWAIYVFPDLDFHVHANDADGITIGLLQFRRIFSRNPNRQCQFVTPRSAGSEKASDEYIAHREEGIKRRRAVFTARLSETSNFDEACRAAGGVFPTDDPVTGASSSSSSSLDKPKAPRSVTIWQEYHIDIRQMFFEILGDVRRDNVGLSQESINQVEAHVLVIMLSSEIHDYIQTNLLCPKVGKQFVWQAFIKHLSEFGKIISVFNSHVDDDLYHGELYYSIDLAVFKNLVKRIYDCKGASFACFQKNMPSDETIRKIASQAVWTMQYLGNGVLPNYVVIDGTSIVAREITDTTNELGEEVQTVTELPLYGYTKSGWADRVHKRCPDTVSCPPITKESKDQ